MLNTRKLAQRLGENHLLAKIPFFVFCSGLLKIQEAKDHFHEPEFIRYEKTADLFEALRRRLEIEPGKN